MCLNRPELWQKLNSLRNSYKNDEAFVANIETWPRTIKKLVYGSEELMINLGMLELVPDPPEEFIGME